MPPSFYCISLEVWDKVCIFADGYVKKERKSKLQPVLNRQLDVVPQVARPKPKNELAVTFGKFCLDLAKLTYGGVFLSAIMQLSYR